MAKKPKIKILWSNKALSLLLEISTFIAEHTGEDKANRFEQEIFNFIKEKLTPFPERYPPCRFEKLKEAGYRCFNFKKKYVIIYKFDGTDIRILAVVAVKRNPQFFNDLLS